MWTPAAHIHTPEQKGCCYAEDILKYIFEWWLLRIDACIPIDKIQAALVQITAQILAQITDTYMLHHDTPCIRGTFISVTQNIQIYNTKKLTSIYESSTLWNNLLINPVYDGNISLCLQYVTCSVYIFGSESYCWIYQGQNVYKDLWF